MPWLDSSAAPIGGGGVRDPLGGGGDPLRGGGRDPLGGGLLTTSAHQPSTSTWNRWQ